MGKVLLRRNNLIRTMHMLRLVNMMLLWALTLGGCTGHLLQQPTAPTVTDNPKFTIVTITQEDTFASIADKYLQDEKKAWKIADYNRINVLTPGQQVVIPKVPLNHGGIDRNGYQTIPVLLYHELAAQPSNSKAVDIGNFRHQLNYLKDNGFFTISLDQFHTFLSLKDQLPSKSIIISFDSTRRWVYEIAYPLLKNQGMKAALFIRLNEIGAKDHVNWNQLAEMAAGGFDIGIRGKKISLPNKESIKHYFEVFEKQLTTPKSIFMAKLKKTCRYFAYTDGAGDDVTIALLKKHGYKIAFTRKRGSNPFFTDDYKIKRSLIFGHFDMVQFRQNLVTKKSAELK